MSTTRSATKQITETEKNEIERRLKLQKVMEEGEAYFPALPNHLLKLANAELPLVAANTPDRKKAWETVIMMAKLMRWQGAQEANTMAVADQLVETMVGKVEEKLETTKTWMEEATNDLKNA